MNQGQEVTMSAVLYNLDELTREIDRLRVRANRQISQGEMNARSIAGLATRLQTQASLLEDNINALRRVI